ncbi:molybdenum cofactor guanylyltransferase [Leptospira sp. 201903071]|uniref:molybdenum cofactor guanylyltransferase n=1 Tax=Leptospira ainazelensis TaxID=2810034 RepID=UPI001966BE64|nr:molybdenum cofactor guanylyltransferase [Leptospira ainazelensis]MBM9499918.1 molybdenum cofactor guanylyltransferase [Leptospira ainazelensis]
MTARKPKGLVLCGGNSSRMGSDKGLLSTEGKLWVHERILTLSPFTDGCLISIRAEQRTAYSKVILNGEFTEDLYENIGPMSGILSAHARFPAENFLVLACDMPSPDSWIFSEILKVYTTNPGKRSYFWKLDGMIEPFPAIYTSELLNEVARKLNDSDFNSSPKDILERSEGIGSDVPKERFKAFLNYNTLPDLSGVGILN